MAAPFDWFLQTIASFRRHPRPLVGGFARLSAIAMIPSVVQLLSGATPGNPGLGGAVFVLSLVFSLVVIPPLLGGAFRLLDACENGRPARAADVLAGFSQAQQPRRMTGIALAMLLVTLVVFSVLFLLMPDKAFWAEVLRVAQSTPPGTEPDLSRLPPFGPMQLLLFLAWIAALTGVSVLMMNVNLFAYARGALSDRGIGAAIVDGFAAVKGNVLPLFAFASVMAVVAVLVLVLAGLVVALLSTLAGAISPALAVMVELPASLAIITLFYALMLGFHYHGWRALFGAGQSTPQIDSIVV